MQSRLLHHFKRRFTRRAGRGVQGKPENDRCGRFRAQKRAAPFRIRPP